MNYMMKAIFARTKIFVILHLMLMVYSLSGVCSKKAAGTVFMSIEFCFYYGIIILLLGFYAIGWQQIIKRLPLTTAFSNKAVTIVWGIVWGVIFFDERISLGKLIGAALVIVGVIMFSNADEKDVKHERV